MNTDKDIIKKIISQFTTQRDGFLYDMFKDNKFRENHPEALWFFNAYDYAYKNYLKDREEYYDRPEVAAQARAMMSIYLANQLSAVTQGIDIDFVIALSGEVQEQRSAEGLSICLLPSPEYFGLHQSSTSILFAESDKKPLGHDRVHAVRKQLELAKTGGLAVCRDMKNNELHTIGILDEEFAHSYPRIVFKRHLEWEFHVPLKSTVSKDITLKTNILSETEPQKVVPTCRLRYKQGSLMMPILNVAKEQRSIICDRLQKKKHSRAEETAATIAALLPAIGNCDHGAVVIFLEREVVLGEAKRLTSVGRGIMLPKQKSLFYNGEPDETLIKRMASIDGAILADQKGNCYAYGVILDGKVSNKRVSKTDGKDRGARYNSTKTYINSVQSSSRKGKRKAARIGIVRSEDGMLDIFIR